MTRKITKRKTAGFTMVEMAVATAILALVVGGFFATFGGANQYAIQSRLQNSAKVVLSAALNEALGTAWVSGPVPNEVHQTTSGPVVYSIRNEGRFAQPTPRQDGEISLFTTPGGEEIIPATLTRWARPHPERTDMLIITFSISWTYRGGAAQLLEANTVVTRES